MTIRPVVPATPEHAASLAVDMREGDRLEVEAWFGAHGTAAGLAESVRRSEWSIAYMDGPRVAILGGVEVVDVLRGVGRPWLLTSPAAARHPTLLARGTLWYVHELRRRFALLENYCDARYAVSLRWLAWMRFQLDPPVPLGPYGAPMVRFWMEGDKPWP